MQKIVNKILAELIEQLIPERGKKGEPRKICNATGLSQSTLRMARSRESISADTLVKLLLAHGVLPETLTNLPHSRPSKICKSLTYWNKVGLNLNEKEREKLGKFIKNLKAEWKLK